MHDMIDVVVLVEVDITVVKTVLVLDDETDMAKVANTNRWKTKPPKLFIYRREIKLKIKSIRKNVKGVEFTFSSFLMQRVKMLLL